jgi:hypothetical protein
VSSVAMTTPRGQASPLDMALQGSCGGPSGDHGLGHVWQDGSPGDAAAWVDRRLVALPNLRRGTRAVGEARRRHPSRALLDMSYDAS